MSHCSSLGEIAAAAAEAENVEEIIVLVESERMFGENHAASDGERYAVSPNAEDDLGEGASDNAKLWTCYFGSSTITVGKFKEMEESGYFLDGEGRAPGVETVPEPMAMKLSYTRTSLSPTCACLHILPWLIFYYIFRHGCIS
jgi:hypothetical protein